MLRITLRDIAFRWRQFLIAVFGAGVVFGLALLLTGVSQGFRTEAEQMVASADADGWVVPAGTQGPMGSATTVPLALVTALRRQPGARDVRPFVFLQDFAHLPGGKRLTVDALAGAHPVPPGTAWVSERLGVEKGETIRLAGRSFRVGRVLDPLTMYAGQPVIELPFAEARRLRFGDAPSASAILVRGTATPPASGFAVLDDAAVATGAQGPVKGGVKTVDTFRALMWIIAALIVGGVTYLSVLERLRDFAVLKAVGGTSRSLAFGVMLGSVLASLGAVLVGMVVATLLSGLFPVAVDLKPLAYLGLPVIGLVVGILASLVALRRVQRVDPALAFGS